MLHRLHINNFTVFREAELQFSPGLNVVIGNNGTGKTHLIKLGYIFCRAWTDLMQTQKILVKKRTESYLEERLEKIFRVHNIASLIRHGQAAKPLISADITGHIPTTRVQMSHEPPSLSPGLDEEMPWKIRLNCRKDELAAIEALQLPEAAPVNAFIPRSIFVPSKEIVSLFKGLIGLFETYRDFPLDETYRDLAVALGSLERMEPKPLFPGIAQRIQQLLGGNLKLENNELVFVQSDGNQLESQLLAEGHRKLAMLIYLVQHGLIDQGGTIFWDEPEANLNPAAIRLLAEALYVLASENVQIIVATHSLFFLRELEILLEQKSSAQIEARFFGLHQTDDGVKVEQGQHLWEIGDITALEESLRQSDRYLESGDEDVPVAD